MQFVRWYTLNLVMFFFWYFLQKLFFLGGGCLKKVIKEMHFVKEGFPVDRILHM